MRPLRQPPTLPPHMLLACMTYPQHFTALYLWSCCAQSLEVFVDQSLPVPLLKHLLRKVGYGSGIGCNALNFLS